MCKFCIRPGARHLQEINPLSLLGASAKTPMRTRIQKVCNCECNGEWFNEFGRCTHCNHRLRISI